MLEEKQLDQTERLIYQASGPLGAPVIVYLPGIQGDWTPMWRLRRLLGARFRLIEVAYPRAPDWTLDDYAAKFARLLKELGLERVHLLAESFGSLVAWTFGLRHPERVASLMLAGGFCRSPGRVRVALARGALGLVPAALLDRAIDLYCWYFQRRRRFPEKWELPDVFFPAARTRQGWRTTRGRLRIINKTDLRPHVPAARFPILYLGGARDSIVPVRREVRHLERALPARCRFRSHLLPGVPHAVLPASFRQADRIITEWVREIEGCADGEAREATIS